MAEEVEILMMRIEHLLDEARQNKEKSGEQIKTLERQLKNMEETSIDAAERKRELQEEVDSLKSAVERNQLLITNKEGEISSAQAAVKRIEATNAEYYMRCKELEEARSRAETLCQELHNELEVEVAKSQREKREISEALVEAKQLSDKLLGENEQLRNEIEKLLDDKRVLEIKEAEGRAKVIDAEGKLRDLARKRKCQQKK